MTMTDPALCAKAPTTGLKMSVMAKRIAMKFSVVEKVKLYLIVVII